MFSNTAYEALYQYLGLSIHSKFIEIITSEIFFKGLILIIFGVIFFMTTLKAVSKYIPNSVMNTKKVPLSAFVKIVFWLFLGLSLLRVEATSEVKNYSGRSWNTNKYIVDRQGQFDEHIKVSFLFDLLSRTTEEVSAFMARIIDRVMAKDHSQLGAPNFFYKAIMYSGMASIDDENVKDIIRFYTNTCFTKILPMIETDGLSNQVFHYTSKMDLLYSINSPLDEHLRKIVVSGEAEPLHTCLDVKTDLGRALKTHAKERRLDFRRHLAYVHFPIPESMAENIDIANMIVNNYMEDKESYLGIMEGSVNSGIVSNVIQHLNRASSWDGALSIVGLGSTHGSVEAAERSQKFSEHLARAPHVAGFIKLVLIAIFPFLVFWVVAGKWKVLVYWFVIYGSVLCWTPAWVFFYHLMTNLAQAGEYMQNVRNFSDGVSLLGAKLITSRIYYFYSVYSWVQLLVATLITGGAVYFLRPMLAESTQEGAPEFVKDAEQAAATAAKVGAIL